MINIFFAIMFLSALISGIYQFIFLDNHEIFNQLCSAIFNNATNAVNISIGLIGIMSFWLGILKLTEATGISKKIANRLTPLFSVIMKDIPKDSPAISSIVMNMAANFLGLDNAATPMGLKAMEEMQKYNPKKDEASDAEILFMILNASSITFIPITIFMYRAQYGAHNPTDVFIPILLATSVSTLTGFILVALKQHISLRQPVLLKYFTALFLFIFSIIVLFLMTDNNKRMILSSILGNVLLCLIIVSIITYAWYRKIKCYEVFIEGAKEGFNISIKIIPYLVAMLVAVGIFRASGILDMIAHLIQYICSFFSIDDRFVNALPTAFMKPISGSGARAMMCETMQTFGANSFEGFLSSVIQGSTETTFYVLTVYFGAINVSKTRYALKYALYSDLAGILAAIGVAYMFY